MQDRIHWWASGAARAVVSDGGATLPDTAWVTWDVPDGVCALASGSAGGSSRHYIGGIELRVEDYAALWTVSDSLFFAVPYDLDVRSVVDDHPEMFQWLSMLDLNVELIIGLMVLIAILNMASACLLLMLERTRSIGLLKALGMADGPLMGVFVRLSVRICCGAWLGAMPWAWVGLCSSRDGIGALDARSYYLSTVPIEIDVCASPRWRWALLLVCACAMFLPARYISRLDPVESLRFD